MKILLLGSGGRECALAIKFLNFNHEVHVIPGNMVNIKVINVKNIKIHEFTKIIKYSKENKIDYAISGPEQPLADGICDIFLKNNIPFFGPKQRCAQLEFSKTFSKKLMQKLNIPTAHWKSFFEYEECIEYLRSIKFPIVIKSSNLAQGKGVSICNNLNDALYVCNEILNKDLYGKNNSVVIEKFLIGNEITFTVLVSKNNYYTLPLTCDYKKAFDNDMGLNTGGMGVVSNPTFVSKSDIEYIKKNTVEPILDYFKSINEPYIGILYVGLIKCNDNIYVLEYNVRFGDPETEVLMEKINNDLGSDIYSLLNNKKITIKENKNIYYGVVVCAKEYPSSYIKNIDMNWINKIKKVKVIPMSIIYNKENLISQGGRIVIFVGKYKNINSLYEQLENYKYLPIHYRTDIRLK